MLKSFVMSHPKTPGLVLIAAFVSFILVIVGTNLGFVMASISESGTTSRTAGSAQRRIEAELITIRPTGFDPAEIERPRERFILAVNNRSGVPELDLLLDREAGERQDAVRLPRGRLGWKKTVDLPPGRYILTEANHPRWACRITITPN